MYPRADVHGRAHVAVDEHDYDRGYFSHAHQCVVLVFECAPLVYYGSDHKVG
jgi:hypothetical protein